MTPRTRKFWKTRDGVRVRIRNMEDRHLRNTILMLIRRAGEYQSEALIHFPSFNGEMAYYCAEQDWDRLNEMSPADFAYERIAIFKDLVHEADFRQLEIPELDDLERDNETPSC